MKYNNWRVTQYFAIGIAAISFYILPPIGVTDTASAICMFLALWIGTIHSVASPHTIYITHSMYAVQIAFLFSATIMIITIIETGMTTSVIGALMILTTVSRVSSLIITIFCWYKYIKTLEPIRTYDNVA
jgi:hypothetical protein